MIDLSKKYKNLNKLINVSKYTIENDIYDLHKFRDLKESNARLRRTNEDMAKTYPQFDELHQDLFDSFYKYDPEKIPINQVAHTHRLNSAIMDSIMESDKYKELRGITRLDEMASTISTEAIGDDVKKLIEELQEEFEKDLQAMDKAAGRAQKAQDKIDNGEGTAKDAKTLKEAQDLMAQKEEELKKLIDRKQKRQLDHMIENAINKATETSDMITNWGLDKSPEFVKGDHQSKLELLNKIRNSRKLKEISQMLGRYKRLALSAQREKVKRGIDEVYDITLGNDINKLLPQELIKLKHPLLHKIFKKDFIERGLMEYELSGKEKKQKGPIIVCIDESGSMSGQSEAWAKATTMGILEVAKIQKRPMSVIHFSSNSSHKDLKINSFSKENYQDITNIVDMIEYFEDGGTNFEPPLDLARIKIDEENTFSKADICFITDGESAVREKWAKEFLAWKKSKKVNIVSILIDVFDNCDASLKIFSDEVHKLSFLRKGICDSIASEIFTSL